MKIPLVSSWFEMRALEKREREKVFQYRQTINEYMRWLGEFPEVCEALTNLYSVVEDVELKNVTGRDPEDYRRVSVDELRNRLRRIRHQREKNPIY